ncbi:hypothetical protein Bache_3090 [Bacteroides helcogenes P 36-108]|uniref:Uncharacterized protein n=1 Tax=Bacteroides helcogenes (strain ATCC 35417 / DSM 20613 / JCM 6297 / CCUG 15421 / P 36-108) TaxID=693979 RepID=E6SQH0_BACT6|nr:hypothetical protein Bache_3090 [Bacteroides helcogenes P 36-108]
MNDNKFKIAAALSFLFFTIPLSCSPVTPLTPLEHLLKGGTMSQELKAIQSGTERLSVPD